MRALVLIMLALGAQSVAAQGSWIPKQIDRAQTWESSFQLVYQSGETLTGPRGANAEFDDDFGFGFGVTYHVNNHFSVGGDFSFLTPSYDATLIDENDQPFNLRARADIFTGQFRGTYHLLAGPLTPYVEGGLGWTYIDSNVTDQPPIVGCWFDPFWGFICGSFFDTYSDTSFSYSAGVGMRWDITPDIGVRGGVSRLRVDLDRGGNSDVDVGKVELVWRF